MTRTVQKATKGRKRKTKDTDESPEDAEIKRLKVPRASFSVGYATHSTFITPERSPS